MTRKELRKRASDEHYAIYKDECLCPPPKWRYLTCIVCEHLNPDTQSCKAFPDGVPDEYSMGYAFHNKVVDNQVGDYVFKECDESVFNELFSSENN